MEKIRIAGTEFSLKNKSFEIYVQGCYRKCPGCHNPGTQPFDKGVEVDIYKFLYEQFCKTVDFDEIIENIYISGGDLLCYNDTIARYFSKCVFLLWSNKYKWLFTGADVKDIPSWVWDYYDIVKCGSYREDIRTEEGTFPASSNQKLLFNKHISKNIGNDINFKGEKIWI